MAIKCVATKCVGGVYQHGIVMIKLETNLIFPIKKRKMTIFPKINKFAFEKKSIFFFYFRSLYC